MNEWLSNYIEIEKLHAPNSNIYTLRFDKIEDAPKVFSFLLSSTIRGEYIYRGHSDNSHRISTTYNRFRRHVRYEDWNTHEEIMERLEPFRFALMQTRGTSLQLNDFELLEYARHQGVPTPVIDFSYSPFVALFFAFCEPNYKEIYSSNSEHFAVVNLVNKSELAIQYLRKLEKDDFCPGQDSRRRFDGYDETFYTNFTHGEMSIIPHPSAFNERMKRQQGLFIYDTLNYGDEYIWGSDFEDMVDKLPFCTGNDFHNPILIKLEISKKMTHQILQYLDSMNINAYNIYPDEYGAVLHSKLSYYYNSEHSCRF